MPRNYLSPALFPSSWASDWGEDNYGLYQSFTYKNIKQTFRWIEQGEFMMGSAKGEKGRYTWEDQHQVILTQGFWIADTVCTQALWQAVIGENPSQFKGENKPVERVSWDDTQEFIKQFNQIDKHLSVRLPTEAEWEYACRAGSAEAFNFEGELDTSKINYRGTWEYKADKWGKGARQSTVEVKSMQLPNAWGLHEMHGNVWEWCQDAWKERLGGDSATDPLVKEGDYRMIRGGSWDDEGRGLRSACRNDWHPGRRGSFLGFRLVLGL